MSQLLLHRNQLISVRSELARVLSLLPDGKTWQLETLHDRVIHRFHDSELRRLYIDGAIDLEPVRDDPVGKAVADRQSRELEDYSEKQRLEAKRRLNYVKAVIAAGQDQLNDSDLWRIICDVAVDSNDQNAPRPSTVRKWANYYLSARGDVRALIPIWHRRGNRAVRQYETHDGKRFAVPSEESEDQLGVALREYLRRERPRASSCFRYIRSHFARENTIRPASRQLRAPSRATVFRRLSAMDPYEKAYYRYGKARADQLLKLKGDGPGASFPLERVEMDATRLDIFVVAPNSGLVIGRPWITVAIDSFSRAILGFYLGFEPPSAITVMHCLRHAIGPKDRYMERFGSAAYQWNMHGVPLLVVVDNAREYRSETVEDAALQLGFDIQQHPVKWPHWKGTIERFFRTLNEGALAWLPGKSFRNVIEKGDYDAASVAVVELTTLEELVTKWILLEYNTKEHGGVRDVPARLWDEGTKKAPPSLPPRIADLDVLLAYTKTMTLTDKGVQFQGLFYKSERLHGILLRQGKSTKVKVKIDDRDISLLRVLDPASGDYIPVPVQGKHADYAAGLSLAEHLAVRRYRKQLAQEAENRPELLEARNKLAEEMASLLGSRRSRSIDKMRAARINARKLADSRAVRGVFDPFESERTISDALLSDEEEGMNAEATEQVDPDVMTETDQIGRSEEPEAGEFEAGKQVRDADVGPENNEPYVDEDPDDYASFSASEKVTAKKRPTSQD